MPKRDSTAYLAPNEEDISSGVSFKLATKASETRWFLAQPVGQRVVAGSVQ